MRASRSWLERKDRNNRQHLQLELEHPIRFENVFLLKPGKTSHFYPSPKLLACHRLTRRKVPPFTSEKLVLYTAPANKLLELGFNPSLERLEVHGNQLRRV